MTRRLSARTKCETTRNAPLRANDARIATGMGRPSPTPGSTSCASTCPSRNGRPPQGPVRLPRQHGLRRQGQRGDHLRQGPRHQELEQEHGDRIGAHLAEGGDGERRQPTYEAAPGGFHLLILGRKVFWLVFWGSTIVSVALGGISTMRGLHFG